MKTSEILSEIKKNNMINRVMTGILFVVYMAIAVQANSQEEIYAPANGQAPIALVGDTLFMNINDKTTVNLLENDKGNFEGWMLNISNNNSSSLQVTEHDYTIGEVTIEAKETGTYSFTYTLSTCCSNKGISHVVEEVRTINTSCPDGVEGTICTKKIKAEVTLVNNCSDTYEQICSDESMVCTHGMGVRYCKEATVIIIVQ